MGVGERWAGTEAKLDIREGGTLYGIEVSQQGGDIGWISLKGEFDVDGLEELRDTLNAAGPEAVVDLSEVTFLDLDCVRELAFYCGIPTGGVRLVNPSWEVSASVAACGLDDWMRFDDGRKPRRAVFSEVS